MKMRRRKIRSYENLSCLIITAMGIIGFAFGFVYAWLGENGCPHDQIVDAVVAIGIIEFVLLMGLCMVKIRLIGLRETEKMFREACHIKEMRNIRHEDIRYIDSAVIRRNAR